MHIPRPSGFFFLRSDLTGQFCPLQVQRIEQRVSMKKTLAVRLEHELLQAQLAAGRGSKRPTESNQTAVRDGFHFLISHPANYKLTEKGLK